MTMPGKNGGINFGGNEPPSLIAIETSVVVINLSPVIILFPDKGLYQTADLPFV